MANRISWSLAIASLLGLSAYFVSGSLFIGGGVLICSFACFFLLVGPLLSGYVRSKRRREEAGAFISSYLLSLSATSSHEKAFNAACVGRKGDLKGIVDSISALSAMEKVEYLLSYFDESVYPMFVSVLKLHQEQGGDVLRLSGELLSESSRVLEEGIAFHGAGIRIFVQFCLMWGLSLLVLIFMKLGLSQFGDYLDGSLATFGSTIAYFAVLLLSIAAFAARFSDGKFAFFGKRRSKRK